MRWDPGHESNDVEDRRGEGGGFGGGGMGGLLYLLPYLLRSPFGWVILLGAIVFYVVRFMFSGAQGLHGGDGRAGEPTHAGDEVHFVGFVLDDVQSSWESALAPRGVRYRHAKLVLYTDATQTGCGYGEAATGPFYCPNDEKVYIDLGFFDELSSRLGAKGQFAQAYVIAHEVGHHVQKILGISDRVKGDTERGANGNSVRMELQADCFAGIWARSTEQRNLLEQGDVEQAMNAAAAVGDDRLQREATGRVAPEKWTHGSSAMRTRWFQRGFQSGSLQQCDTFSAPTL